MIIVTGVSRGLGKAIAEYFLSQDKRVLGIGRSIDIVHPLFSFKYCDLANLEEVQQLTFDELPNSVTLINNAGILGEVNRLADMPDMNISTVLNVNVSAVALLTQKVYSRILNKENFTLVNISSGAARRAIPSWSLYCASKAALNMLSECFYLEEKERGNDPKVYIIAPGVIDTGMQETIRLSDPDKFSSHSKFVTLKEENELFTPEEAAKRLAAVLNREFTGELNFDLRDVFL